VRATPPSTSLRPLPPQKKEKKKTKKNEDEEEEQGKFERYVLSKTVT